MKNIIWGYGKRFARLIKYIETADIVAVTDSDPDKWGTLDTGMEVISPQKALDVLFDYIIVTPAEGFEEIKLRLTEDFNIPENKILDYEKGLFLYYPYHKLPHYRSINLFFSLISEGKGRLLDYGCILPEYGMLSDETIEPPVRFGNGTHRQSVSMKNYKLTGCNHSGKYLPLVCEAIYDTVLGSIDDHKGKPFDMLISADLIVRDFMPVSEKCLRAADHTMISRFLKFADELLIRVYDPSDKLYDSIKNDHSLNVRYFREWPFSVMLISKSKKNPDLRMFVVAHKKFEASVSPEYTVIHVGDSDFVMPGMQCDNTGDNISYLNPKLNECTALYWIWKNVRCRYIGLDHYRRYFLRNGVEHISNVIDEKTAISLLRDYDIILSHVFDSGIVSIREWLDMTAGDKCYVDLVRDKLIKYQPDYLKSFDYVMDGHTMYVCNMMITRKEIFDEYCEWLFSFIIEAAEDGDVSGLAPYPSRIFAFIAERMLKVWLLQHNYRIKEQTILFYEPEEYNA